MRISSHESSILFLFIFITSNIVYMMYQIKDKGENSPVSFLRTVLMILLMF